MHIATRIVAFLLLAGGALAVATGLATPALAQDDDAIHIEVDFTANENTMTAVLDVYASISGRIG